MADADCLKCHQDRALKAQDVRAMFVDEKQHQASRHAKVACSQCHSGVNVSLTRPCDAIAQEVDCGACHTAVAQEYAQSQHLAVLPGVRE